MTFFLNMLFFIAFLYSLGNVAFVLGFTIKNDIDDLPSLIRWTYLPCVLIAAYGIYQIIIGL